MTPVIKRSVPFVLAFALGLGVVSLLRAVNREASKAPNEIPSVETHSLNDLPCGTNGEDWRTTVSIVFNPPAMYTTIAREQGITGTVRLYANVFGDKLTDVSVFQGLPAGLTAQAVKAAKRIRIKATFCGKETNFIGDPVELEYFFPSNGEARLIRL